MILFRISTRALLPITAVVVLLIGGCAASSPGDGSRAPQLTPITQSYHDLVHLPPPKGRIAAAVYGFRDLTGQYKASPESSFSTIVTQGAASMLVKGMLDSGWFLPVERENLQNLLTERKIERSAAQQMKSTVPLPPLLVAKVMLEGGIISYESDVKTGGLGAKYFGVGASGLYRTDQVTVSLRVVDLQNGRVVSSISVTKTILSQEVDVNMFRFVKFKRLLEIEGGYSSNEPAQMCVNDAIESALVHTIARGIRDGLWSLQNPEDIKSPILAEYLNEQDKLITDPTLAAPVALPGQAQLAPVVPPGQAAQLAPASVVLPGQNQSVPIAAAPSQGQPAPVVPPSQKQPAATSVSPSGQKKPTNNGS